MRFLRESQNKTGEVGSKNSFTGMFAFCFFLEIKWISSDDNIVFMCEEESFIRLLYVATT